uniref:Uncharacterized protein n=1 Tax=Anguilla anguilla TaxID=7936 RepID=A0A0E9XHD6_ANGAN
MEGYDLTLHYACSESETDIWATCPTGLWCLVTSSFTIGPPVVPHQRYITFVFVLSCIAHFLTVNSPKPGLVQNRLAHN